MIKILPGRAFLKIFLDAVKFVKEVKAKHHQPGAVTKAAVLLDLTKQRVGSGKIHVIT